MNLFKHKFGLSQIKIRDFRLSIGKIKESLLIKCISKVEVILLFLSDNLKNPRFQN